MKQITDAEFEKICVQWETIAMNSLDRRVKFIPFDKEDVIYAMDLQALVSEHGISVQEFLHRLDEKLYKQGEFAELIGVKCLVCGVTSTEEANTDYCVECGHEFLIGEFEEIRK